MGPQFLDSFADNLMVFYLLIGANYIAALFSCQLQAALKHNMAFKHFLGFMTLYFSVVLLIKKDDVPVNPARKLVDALLLYGLFVLSTRMPFGFSAIVIMLLFVIYYLNGTKDYYAEIKDDKQRNENTVAIIERVQKTLKYLAFALILTGFVIYLGQKSREYKKEWDWMVFMFGKPSCKENFLPKKYIRTIYTDLLDGLKMFLPLRR
jgi:hypothetical protein